MKKVLLAVGVPTLMATIMSLSYAQTAFVVMVVGQKASSSLRDTALSVMAIPAALVATLLKSHTIAADIEYRF